MYKNAIYSKIKRVHLVCQQWVLKLDGDIIDFPVNMESKKLKFDCNYKFTKEFLIRNFHDVLFWFGCVKLLQLFIIIFALHGLHCLLWHMYFIYKCGCFTC